MPAFIRIKQPKTKRAPLRATYHGGSHPPLYKLRGGRVVIDEDVDEHNQLWYVVEGSPPKRIPAIGQMIVAHYATNTSQRQTVTVTTDKHGKQKRTVKQINQ